MFSLYSALAIPYTNKLKEEKKKYKHFGMKNDHLKKQSRSNSFDTE
jgi:hypothetical protein